MNLLLEGAMTDGSQLQCTVYVSFTFLVMECSPEMCILITVIKLLRYVALSLWF